MGEEGLYNYRVTPSFFRVLGVAPALGRALGEDDAAQTDIVPAIIAYSMWRSRWGGDPDVIGRAIRRSLGATPIQLAAETGARIAVLAAVVIAVGWLAVPPLMRLAVAQLPPELFRHTEAIYSWRTVAGSIALALAGVLAFHLSAARYLTRHRRDGHAVFRSWRFPVSPSAFVLWAVVSPQHASTAYLGSLVGRLGVQIVTSRARLIRRSCVTIGAPSVRQVETMMQSAGSR